MLNNFIKPKYHYFTVQTMKPAFVFDGRGILDKQELDDTRIQIIQNR